LGSLRDHAALFLGERRMILSPREKKLLRRFAQGKTDRQIAWEIGGTEQQVSVQRRLSNLASAIAALLYRSTA
ncbi:MAG: LuxR C-terminal-related transcriptional regulator, partial [Pseudolabrys sp.]